MVAADLMHLNVCATMGDISARSPDLMIVVACLVCWRWGFLSKEMSVTMQQGVCECACLCRVFVVGIVANGLNALTIRADM